jgi:predicted amidophosphoribosyltransferase
MPDVKCQSCGASISEAAAICPSCKQPLTASRIFRFHSTMPEKPPAPPPKPAPPPASSLARFGQALMIAGPLAGLGAALSLKDAPPLILAAIAGGPLLLGAALWAVGRRRSIC